MSFRSDFLKLALRLIDEDNTKTEDDILNLIMNAAKTAGISNSPTFGDSVDKLIQGARFLDSYKDLVYATEANSQATLSRFSTYLRTQGEKNSFLGEQQEQDSIDKTWGNYALQNNIAINLFDAESIRFNIDSYFLRQYDALLTKSVQEMREAYVRNTKFEQEINQGIDSNQRYYTFFSLQKVKGEGVAGLKDVLTISSDIMDQIITNTELFQLRVIPQVSREDLAKNNQTIADQVYNVSLGLNSSNIIKKLKDTIGKENLENLQSQGKVFQGLIREDSSGNLGRVLLNDTFNGKSILKEDFKSLLTAQRSGRVLSQTTGERVSVNRLSEIMFDVKRIQSVKDNKTITHNVDSISSLTGLDVNFSKGGGVSVKTYGGTSNSIQLTGSTLITSAQQHLGGDAPTAMLRGIVQEAFRLKDKEHYVQQINELSQKISTTYIEAFNKKHPEIQITSRDIDSLLLTFLEENGLEKDMVLGNDRLQESLFSFIAETASEDADKCYNEAQSEIEDILE